jgi:NADPH:quinone reductase-like Zn-dependent oxidoreductase
LCVSLSICPRSARLTQNPTDWKHVAALSTKGSIIGCDYSGVVVEVPGSVSSKPDHIKVGARVAGWVHGGLFKDRGAFAQYLKVPANLTFPVPEGMSPREACTFGIPFYTAFHALKYSQKGPWPPAKEGSWVSGPGKECSRQFLVYGGSSGVGLFTIQLAKLMGHKVVTACSARNFDLVKSYGADAVFDYNDGEGAIKAIREATGGGVHKALDCISLPDSNAFTLACFADGKGQMNVILPPDAKAAAAHPDVDVQSTLLYTLWGRAFEFGPRNGAKLPLPAIKEELRFHEELVSKIPEFIALGFKAPPIEERGGIDDIAQGLADMRDGKLSGKRYVYTIA